MGQLPQTYLQEARKGNVMGYGAVMVPGQIHRDPAGMLRIVQKYYREKEGAEYWGRTEVQSQEG